MMGGLGGGASLQKAQSLIDLGSSRYEGLKPPTFNAFNKEYLQTTFFFVSSELIQILTLQWPNVEFKAYLLLIIHLK